MRAPFALLVCCAVAASGPVTGAPSGQPATGAGATQVTYQGGTTIRILPPRQRPSSGPTLVETLLLDPEVRQVVFYVDGEVRSRQKRPPWQTRVRLDAPPREQVLRVEALDALDRLVGRDELVVNKVDQPLRLVIRSLERGEGRIELRARVSMPEAVRLDEIEVFLNQQRVGRIGGDRFTGGLFEVSFDEGEARPDDFVRLVAHLGDGRSLEDTQLVSAETFQDEIDVQLVQLQVLVTDRQGRPLEGLAAENFEIVDADGARPPAGLFAADDVSLLLGYAIDSSGSMQPIWEQAMAASRLFLDATLRQRDEGFLVDFDYRIRLIQGRTADRAALDAGLATVAPQGGTALYDAVLFSLLQFDRQQGRRGLVVLSDGFDEDSQSHPDRAVELAIRLGVPIYIVALDLPGPEALGVGAPEVGTLRPGLGPKAWTRAFAEVRRLTEPTGGRLLRVRSLDEMRGALTQINAEMRSQYVLTYYTDTPPEAGSPPEVRVTVEGMEGLEVRTVLGADRIY